jgi:hypothetical protein
VLRHSLSGRRTNASAWRPFRFLYPISKPLDETSALGGLMHYCAVLPVWMRPLVALLQQNRPKLRECFRRYLVNDDLLTGLPCRSHAGPSASCRMLRVRLRGQAARPHLCANSRNALSGKLYGHIPSSWNYRHDRSWGRVERRRIRVTERSGLRPMPERPSISAPFGGMLHCRLAAKVIGLYTVPPEAMGQDCGGTLSSWLR